MFKHAIVRTPCRALLNGLTKAHLGVPNYEKALQQHQCYIDALKSCNVEVTILPPSEQFPDSVFIEDTILCTPHCAIITRPNPLSRRHEPDSVAAVMRRFYDKIEQITPSGTVEAGDIMMVGNHYYIGVGSRTNLKGANQLISILDKCGLGGSVVPLNCDILHLKTGVSYLEHNNLLVSEEFSKRKEFGSFNLIEVPNSESYAANCVWVNDKVVVPIGFPITLAKIMQLGYETVEVDVSEFRKMDGGLSCLSLRF